MERLEIIAHEREPTQAAWRHLRPILLLALAWLLPSPLRAADPDLPEIARRLQDWRRAFANIEVTYHAWNREHSARRFPEVKDLANLDGQFHRRHLLIWTDTGQIWREDWFYERGILVNRSLDGTNGTVVFSASMDRGKSMEEWTQIQVHPVVGEPKAGIVFEPLYLLWWKSGQEWLGDVLARGEDAELRGFQVREGVRCAVVEVKKRSIKDQDKFDLVEIWLDTEHDFLPRWFERDAAAEDPRGKLKPPRSLRKFTILEFQNLENGRWFPRRGFLKSAGDDEPGNEWVVKEVRLNQVLAPARFEPPPRPKASEQRAIAEQRIAEQAKKNLREASSPAVAELPNSNWRLIVLLTASALLLIAGVWLRIRRA